MRCVDIIRVRTLIACDLPGNNISGRAVDGRGIAVGVQLPDGVARSGRDAADGQGFTAAQQNRLTAANAAEAAVTPGISKGIVERSTVFAGQEEFLFLSEDGWYC